MNDTARLVARFLSTAESHPNRVFLIGERTLSYGAAAEEVTQRANELKRLSDGLPVILRGPNTPEWILCFLAARVAGLCVMPLSDKVTDEQWHELQEIVGRSYVFDTAEDRGALSFAIARRQIIPERAAICLRTSGSTGLPRYALRSEQSLLAEGKRYAESLKLAATDRILAALPLCHAFTLGLALGGAIAAGCALHVIPRFSPRTVRQLLLAGEQSILPLVPATARLLCKVFRAEDPKPLGLRHIIIGAGPVTRILECKVVERLGRLPARGYGSSETGATLGTAGQPVPEATVGVELPGVEIAIASVGTPAALFVRTAEPFLGYLLPNGVDTSRIGPDGWYSTGDLATRDDQGWIFITGRIGAGLRRGGQFIQPTEVERALRGHPSVADVLVTGEQDEHGEDVVEAHIETQPGVHLDVVGLRQYLEQRIEAYKIPTRWHFYDALPRTEGGKPDRTHLHGARNDKAILNMTLLSALASHRLGTAISVAQRQGILSTLDAMGGRAEEIAAKLGLDKDGVKVLLELLASIGMVERNFDNTYSAVELLSGAWLDYIIELEACLQRTWLSIEAVEAVVRNGMQDRAFEEDPGKAFLQVYTETMEASAKVLALHAWHYVDLPQGPVLDLGRPAGAWAEIVRQRAPDHESIVFHLPPGHLPFKFTLPPGPLAGIFIHNGVRRLAESDCTLSLTRLCDALNPEGALMVSDVFIDAPAPNRWLRPAMMLDWLTHGSIAWPSGSEFCSVLTDLGFESIRRVHIGPMFELIIARNRRGTKE